MNSSKKDFFKFIYQDNVQRVINKRDIRKDLAQWEVNQKLLPQEDILTEKYYKKHNKFCNYFIVGTPRSGSTLLSQIIANSFDLGYQRNFAAKYYAVPLHGYTLMNNLDSTDIAFKSSFGNTIGANSPHEFGYFWQYWLKFKDHHEPSLDQLNMVDWHRLNVKLNSLANFHNKDFLIKNQVYINFIMHSIWKQVDNSKFIFIQRNPKDVIKSILNARYKVYEDYNYWWSIKPKAYIEWLGLDPVDQVTHQVLYTTSKIYEQLDKIRSEDYIIVDYEKVIDDPKELINRLSRWFGLKAHFTATKLNSIYKRSHSTNFSEIDSQIRMSLNRITPLYNL